jgi:hypothetical protein
VTIVVPDLNEIKTWAVNQPAIDKFTMDHPEKLINHPGTSLIPPGARARHDTSAAGASRRCQPSVSPNFSSLCCCCCSQPPVSLLLCTCRHAEAVDGRAGRRVRPHEELRTPQPLGCHHRAIQVTTLVIHPRLALHSSYSPLSYPVPFLCVVWSAVVAAKRTKC